MTLGLGLGASSAIAQVNVPPGIQIQTQPFANAAAAQEAMATAIAAGAKGGYVSYLTSATPVEPTGDTQLGPLDASGCNGRVCITVKSYNGSACD
jgi:hypothetical protein